MITREDFQSLVKNGPLILDGAIGSNLYNCGMPLGCATDIWCLEHPDILRSLQEGYVAAGSKVLYTATFMSHPKVLQDFGLAMETERINEDLAKLTRSVSDSVLVAGSITNHISKCSSFEEMVGDYRRQVKGLLNGGVDFIVGETLLSLTEVEAIYTACELEGCSSYMFSLTMLSGGFLLDQTYAGPVLQQIEALNPLAVGFNCVPADSFTEGLVQTLRKYVNGPLVCKPNGGIPTLTEKGASYAQTPDEFAEIVVSCNRAGANILGGCCGTSPQHIRTMVQRLF